MKIAVQKYGGTSLASSAQIRSVAGRVAECRRDGLATVVVVSARGASTDRLIAEAAEVAMIRSGRELDQLLVTGENAAAALVALALQDRGMPAISLTAAQGGISAVGRHGTAMIAEVDDQRIRRHLATGKVVVVAGFQGMTPDGDVVTLGRGGSDTTAVALAAALDAVSCEIYTDVEGVFTADPRIVPQARVLDTVGVGVMAEMAFAGARVLHCRAVELAAARGMDLVVRNSMSRQPGTTILGRSDPAMMENDGFVTAVTHDPDAALVRIEPMRDNPDLARYVLGVLAAASVPVDMVTLPESGGGTGRSMRFTIRRSDVPDATDALGSSAIGADARYTMDPSVGKLSLVGAGLFSRPENAAAMLDVLAEQAVPVSLIAATQLRITAVVPRDRLVAAAAALHRRLNLDRPEIPTGSLTLA
ncbi:aspartate kinase [Solwaraspora sp. WMMD791]|uniref:aspartate kinase n=1 Tax=Solwaraspora sp. WMMD791 TaxID=3016086 RepID=UPI00249C18D6|nr:aspartate kinase [Solwaraspora sp. WMMD791]WFE30115.1 aspartate kinase [Solwaraspora sp. WMMD791]